MISNAQNENGTFSADVRLNLHIGQRRIELGHLGPGFALLGEAQSIEATEGEIETIVDDKVTRWPIRITSKLDGSTKRFEFEGVG
jgi:hypothetical protein